MYERGQIISLKMVQKIISFKDEEVPKINLKVTPKRRKLLVQKVADLVQRISRSIKKQRDKDQMIPKQLQMLVSNKVKKKKKAQSIWKRKWHLTLQQVKVQRVMTHLQCQDYVRLPLWDLRQIHIKLRIQMELGMGMVLLMQL